MMYTDDHSTPSDEPPKSAIENGAGSTEQQPIWHSLFCYKEEDTDGSDEHST